MSDNKLSVERSCAALVDMLRSAQLINQYLEDWSEESFYASQEKQDSVGIRIAIISEAAGRILPSIRHKYPQVPWGKIKGMRNILLHEYDRVDATFVWDVYEDHLPQLIAALNDIVKAECY